jgi:hypothetical protein
VNVRFASKGIKIILKKFLLIFYQGRIAKLRLNMLGVGPLTTPLSLNPSPARGEGG